MNQEQKNTDIQNLLSEISQTSVPPEVEAKMRTHLTDFQARLREKEKKYSFADFIESVQKIFTPKVRYAFVFAIVVGAIFLTTFFNTPNSSNGDLYAAVVQQLRNMYAISYEIVIAPYTSVEIAKRDPGLSRIQTSWGVEILTDAVKQKRLILLHYMKKYFVETTEGKPVKSEYDEIYNSFKNLPDSADQKLAEKQIDGQRVAGYRVKEGEESLDIWLNPTDKSLVQVDINFHKDQEIVYQMHIRNLRINDQVAFSELSFEPPQDYEALTDKKEKEQPLLKF